MKAVRFSVLWLTLSLSGCGDGSIDDSGVAPAQTYPIPGCEQFDSTPCDVRAAGCQTRLFAIASCLHGDEPGEPPPVTMFTQTEYALYLNEWLSTQPTPEPYYERALVLLGLVAPGALSSETFVQTQVDNVFGFYRGREKDIFLIDRVDPPAAEIASAVLVHEYIHALQDRVVGLDAFREEHASFYDSFLAIDALVEGEARLHETRYAVSAIGLNPADLDWRKHFQTALERGEDEVLGDPSPYTATWGVFPYSWGARYMHFVWQGGGNAALLEQYAMPPTTTSVLMASRDGAGAQDFAPLQIEAPVPAGSWTLADETVLGAWGTYLLLANGARSESAHSTALGWRGDGFFVYVDDLGATGAVWRVEFADVATASAAASLLARFGPSLQHRETRLVLALSRGSSALAWAFEP